MGQWIGCFILLLSQNLCSSCSLVDKIPENAFPGENLVFSAFCQICSSTVSQLFFLNNFLRLRRDRGSVFPIFFTIFLSIFRSLRVAPFGSVSFDD